MNAAELDLLLLCDPRDDALVRAGVPDDEITELESWLRFLGATEVGRAEARPNRAEDVFAALREVSARARVIVFVVGPHFPRGTWPAPDIEVEGILRDRAIVALRGVTASQLRACWPLAGELEVVDLADGPDAVAEFLVRILRADHGSRYRRLEPSEEVEMLGRVAEAFVRVALGDVGAVESERLERALGGADWTRGAARALRTSPEAIRDRRQSLAALTDRDAVVAITEMLMAGVPGWRPDPSAARVFRMLRGGTERLPGQRSDTAARDERDAQTAPRYSRGDVVRVFISSTFHDMHAERELLTKHVFPTLRERCWSRGVELSEVDLRWGVTESEARSKAAVGRCLSEIEQCRPYFVGVAGARYGWVPDAFDAESLRLWPWLWDCAGLSVSEIEFLHGTQWSAGASPSHCLLYLRDPEYAQRFAPSERPDYESSPGEAARQRLLRERMRSAAASGATLREYATPEVFALMVQEDLWERLAADLPSDTASDLILLENAQQRGFLDRTAARAVPRPECDALVAPSEGPAGPCPFVALVAPAGAGKTTYLADWVEHRAHAGGGVVVWHTTEASLLSGDVVMAVGGLTFDLLPDLLGQDGFRVPVGDPEALYAMFALVLETAACRGPFTLVIDGVDRLQGQDGAASLGWLPNRLPAACRMVVSARPGRTVAALESRGFRVVTLPAMSAVERRQFLERALAVAGKHLEPAIADRVVDAPVALHPGHLATFVDELRLYGHHESLAERAERCAAARDAVDLYDLVLERAERDYSDFGREFVADALRLLCVSADGLAARDLCALLVPVVGRVPERSIDLLLLALGRAVRQSLARVWVADDAARDAIRRRYLPSDEAVRAVHRRLATWHLATAESTPAQRAREDGAHGAVAESEAVASPASRWPVVYHLAAAEMWEPLVDFVADADVLRTEWRRHSDQILEFWRRIERSGGPRMRDVYRDRLEAYMAAGSSRGLWFVQALLHGGESDAVLEVLRPHSKPIDADIEIAAGLERLRSPYLRGLAYALTGREAEAIDAFAAEVEEARKEEQWQSAVSALIDRSAALQRLGRFSQAMSDAEEAERCARLYGLRGTLANALRCRAFLLRVAGDADAAARLAREAAVLESGNA